MIMKVFFIAFIIFSVHTLKAEVTPNYKIIQRSLDHTVTGDSLLITGKVHYKNELPASHNFGKVAALDFSVANIIGRSGKYQIKIHRKAKGFYYFQNGYQEVVVDLSRYTENNRFEIDIQAGQYLDLPHQAEKPVIYLYSTKPIRTNLILNPTGELTFTYPQYQDNWRVETQKNGQITNLATGKSHPYLFWEANQPNASFQAEGGIFEGYIIQTDTAVQFLENQLAAMGLNEHESTDFITYWAPRLMAKEYATIQFLLNDDYDSFFGDISSSTPLDFKLRIGMLFKVHGQKPTFKVIQPSYENIEKRHGFSLIEWGGVELRNGLVALQ